ncbi:hypothetical protein [Xanthomonas arboricola]|uniref:Uncharacterized protein n=4 Tax=Xanthomonas arboricola pv. pruni TaxID=69929 RepID=A0AAQ1AKK0_9XANT|nr:hypothetical protein [Xanthomonas arboricola]GAE50367.1 hypothetical protein XPU_1899 [Xanthomonas arboricola pv. pruni str. MAFF 311562]GAE57575.1 hypothetical protein XPR_4210 [Xanthomonas arboricola pv. pruni MAFF 301420]KCX01766.1 membrane protein [Xanthomonas arboricola pv. pruni]KPN10016.1 hypothetical protein AN652_13970 [Xanthomonas arboricola pv. pruni]MDN0266615.1 hypothetical protein [Xanthomonas arboricola pv. pruni]
MLGKTKGVALAYLPSALLVLAGFGVAELLQMIAAARQVQWPATLAMWLSLAALIAAIARALWVSWRLWRLWRPRGVAAAPPGGDI